MLWSYGASFFKMLLMPFPFGNHRKNKEWDFYYKLKVCYIKSNISFDTLGWGCLIRLWKRIISLGLWLCSCTEPIGFKRLKLKEAIKITTKGLVLTNEDVKALKVVKHLSFQNVAYAFFSLLSSIAKIRNKIFIANWRFIT